MTLYNIKKPHPQTAIYIGRGTPWGNPYRIGPDGSRQEVITLFNKNVLPTLDVEPLRGKDLVCHCVPKLCHGHSILRKLRETKS